MPESYSVESSLQAPAANPAADVPECLWTERLCLRPTALSDAPEMFMEICAKPEVTRYLTWATHTNILETFDFIRTCQSTQEEGGAYFWTAVSNDDQLLGVTTLAVQDRRVQIGYVLASSQWGKGYAAEAASAMIDWAATLDGIDAAFAICDTENAASAGVLDRLGFTRRGVIRDAFVCPNLGPASRNAFLYELEMQRYFC